MFDADWSNKILAIHLGTEPHSEKAFWPLSKSGLYDVKSGYGAALEDFLKIHSSTNDDSRIEPNLLSFVHSSLWSLPGPCSWRILIWKILSKSPPLGEEFLRRGLDTRVGCVLCYNDDQIETYNHLFRDCAFVQRVWAGCDLGIRCWSGNGISLASWDCNWICYLSKSLGTEELNRCAVIRFMGILWSIWITRNEAWFGNTKPNGTGTIKHYEMIVAAAICADKNASRKRGSPSPLRELGCDDQDNGDDPLSSNLFAFSLAGPMKGCHRLDIMVDAAWHSCSKAAVGWILSDHGCALSSKCFKIRAEDSLQAEARGVRDALSWAREKGILHLTIASDCQTLVLEAAGWKTASHCIWNLLEDIRSISVFFHCLCFKFIPRSGNHQAHVLAKWALRR